MTLFDDEPSELRGSLTQVWFRGDGGFAVGQFTLADSRERVTVRGEIADLEEGQSVKLSGEFEDHPRYGRQFRVEAIELERPVGSEAIEAYLASGAVKGVGKELARRIVKALGDETLDRIEEDPESLRRVPGIGKKRAGEIHEAVREQASLRDVLLFLHGNKLPSGLASRILDAYGKDAARLLTKDPYRLAEDLVGVGFRKADDVAGRLGLDPHAPERFRAAILHSLKQSVTREGHCCVRESKLLDAAAALVAAPAEQLAPELGQLVEERRVVREKLPGLPVLTDGEEARVYPLTLHVAETSLVAALMRLRKARRLPLHDTKQRIKRWEKSARIALQPEQRLAIETALAEPVSVLTGGPGVGKTTIIRALASIAEDRGGSVALAAPTGRAAKRLSEACEREARTLHRLLEYQPGNGSFARNEHNPIEATTIVVDETSMLDLPLAYQLVRSVRRGAQLVLVGDVDQLPSVGPGTVLEDIISSGFVEVVRLRKVFRQREGSGILSAAHRILDGRLPELSESEDFFFIERRDAQQGLETLLQVVTERIPQAFGFDAIQDVQVLCPMYRGPLGVDRVNDELAKRLLPPGEELVRGSRRFRKRDKVLQIRNNYDLELYNGDPGRIEHIDASGGVLVRFAEREIELSGADLDQIVRAYGITVHRSQGSEYPAVVVTLDQGHSLMLNRRLLYTAVTRARRLLVLLGSRWALERAVGQDLEGIRETGLGARLQALSIGDGVHPEDWVRPPAAGASRNSECDESGESRKSGKSGEFGRVRAIQDRANDLKSSRGWESSQGRSHSNRKADKAEMVGDSSPTQGEIMYEFVAAALLPLAALLPAQDKAKPQKPTTKPSKTAAQPAGKGAKPEVGRRMSARHILIPWKGSAGATRTTTMTKVDAKKKADEVVKLLSTGGDFSKLALAHSSCRSKVDGGYLGQFDPHGHQRQGTRRSARQGQGRRSRRPRRNAVRLARRSATGDQTAVAQDRFAEPRPHLAQGLAATLAGCDPQQRRSQSPRGQDLRRDQDRQEKLRRRGQGTQRRPPHQAQGRQVRRSTVDELHRDPRRRRPRAQGRTDRSADRNAVRLPHHAARQDPRPDARLAHPDPLERSAQRASGHQAHKGGGPREGQGAAR